MGHSGGGGVVLKFRPSIFRVSERNAVGKKEGNTVSL